MHLSVIIPAHNEAALILLCLSALIEGHDERSEIMFEIVVIANACDDETAHTARSLINIADKKGIALRVFETAVAGKTHALNLGDRMSFCECRVYLDADVICDRGMISELATALDTSRPRFASGHISPVTNGRFFTVCYGFVWSRLPFVKTDVSGCGLYAVNAAGRQRWATFPQMHSDDKFVRLHFKPKERIKVNVQYLWPLPKNLWDLIKVRSRWCRGNAELKRDFPSLLVNDHSQKIYPKWAIGFTIRHPVSSVIFTFVYVAAKLRALIYSDSLTSKWERSR